jgi:3-hydroxymyristoyl/3-hydroxydecanoyl-(acyl carrier protein) dehydratase
MKPFRTVIPRYIKPLVLLVFPALVAVLGVMHIIQHPVQHYTGSDPAYAYLLNGLTLAEGSSDIGHTDNPGTTVQAFTAVVIRAVYLFRSAESVADDVIAHPELYIKAAQIAILLMNVLLVFWLGIVVLKKSGDNWWLTLFAQMLLFFSQYLIIYHSLLMPESFLIAGGIVFTAICIHYLYEESFTPRKLMHYGIGFGIVTAFMCVSKFPAIVLVLIPLIALPGNKFKLIYLLSTAVSAVVFILPARENISNFFSFLFRMLTHKGTYGSGEEGFADGQQYLNNLNGHFQVNPVYFGVLFIGILLIVVGLIRFQKIFLPNQYKFRLLAGIILAMLLNIAMASKQFAWHYLISTQISIGVLIIVIVFILKSVIHFEKLNASFLKTRFALGIFVVIIPLFLLSIHRPFYKFVFHLQDHSDQVVPAFDSFGKLPTVYASRYCNGPSPVCGFDFGFAFSGDIRSYYAEIINKFYPNSWFFNFGNSTYNSFGQAATLKELAARFPKFLFYINRSDSAEGLAQIRLLENFKDSSGNYVVCKSIYYHPVTHEQIWEITSDTARANSPKKVLAKINCDFETIRGDSVFTSTVDVVYVGNTNLKTTAKARSGKLSLALNGKDQYGGGVRLPVAKGMQYEISVWCTGNTAKRAIVVQGEGIYAQGTVPQKTDSNGWKLLSASFTVPQDYPKEYVNLFFWNFSGNDDPVYWDDLEIKVFQLE